MKLVFAIFVMAMTAAGQNAVIAPVIPTPEEQVTFQSAQRTFQKASESLATVTAKLPEADALKKAQDAFDAAVKKLPETAARETAYTSMLNEAYRTMAKRGLSSREWEPRVSPKGDLEFHKCALIPCGTR